MQRPLRSQSPKRVGSRPEGPPISRRRSAGSPASATGIAREWGSEGGTDSGFEEFFSGLICIFYKCARIQLPRPRWCRASEVNADEYPSDLQRGNSGPRIRQEARLTVHKHSSKIFSASFSAIAPPSYGRQGFERLAASRCDGAVAQASSVRRVRTHGACSSWKVNRPVLGVFVFMGGDLRPSGRRRR